MNWLSKIRVRLGVGILPPDVKGVAVRSSSGSWGGSDTPKVKTNYTALVKDGWRRNELIYACSSKKARTASQVALKVYDKKNNKELPDHDLRKLIKNPNPKMTEFDFWSSVFIFQDFAGKAVYEKVRSRSGKVVQLWPMRPDWVTEKKDGNYTYGEGQYNAISFKREDVLVFSLWDPLGQYNGYPPVAVAARVGDIDNSVTDYIRLLFKEGGVPPGILKTTQGINEAIATRAREIWKQQYGGFNNWLTPAVLGHDMEYQKTGLGLDDMQIELLDERNETRICMAMMVPPTVVSASIGLKRAIMSNAQEFRRDWWLDDLIPMYKNLNDTLLNQLVPDFGDTIETRWDFHNVPALAILIESKRKWALEAFSSGAITRNQFYAEIGMDELGPVGDVYLVSALAVEVPAGKAGMVQSVSLSKSLPSPVSAKAEDPEDMDERLEHEGIIADAMGKYLDGQLERIKSLVEAQVSHRPKE